MTALTGPSPRVVTETVADWAPGAFLENLAAGPDGGWLVTIPSHRRIDRVGRDGRTEVFAELDRMPTGIGALVLAGAIGTRNWQLVRVSPGWCEVVGDLPDLVFGNGMQRSGDRVPAVDSAWGLVLEIDAAGGSTVWLRHPLPAPTDPGTPMPGANGVAVHQDRVYVSNTARGLLVRCSLARREVEVVAEILPADDFAVRPDGRRTELARGMTGSTRLVRLRLTPAGAP